MEHQNKSALRDGWILLQKEMTDAVGVRSIPIIVSENCRASLALAQPGKSESIIFQFSLGLEEFCTDDIELSGLTLKAFEQPTELKYQKGIILSKQEGYDIEIFSTICVSLLNILANNDFCSGSDAHFQIIHRLRVWIKFLRDSDSKVLGFKQQVGLLGELLFLDSLKKHLDDELVWMNSWRGPDKDEHDFVLSDSSFEVKTLINDESQITISNLKQLDTKNVPELYLVLCKLTETSGSESISLGQIIDEVSESIVDQKCFSLFLSKLKAAGFRSSHLKHYQNRYELTGFSFLLIEEGFPRLTKQLVPTAISSCKYNLDQKTLANFLVDPDKIFEGND